MFSVFNPYVILVALAMLAGSYGTGRWHQAKSDRAEQTATLLKATQDARAKEQQAAIEQGVIVDALLQKQAILGVERDAIATRLRKLSASRSELAASCASSDEAAGSLIPDRTRADLVAQALRANEVVNQLTAAQEAIASMRKHCAQ